MAARMTYRGAWMLHGANDAIAADQVTATTLAPWQSSL
jgi:hypothetical protein